MVLAFSPFVPPPETTSPRLLNSHPSSEEKQFANIALALCSGSSDEEGLERPSHQLPESLGKAARIPKGSRRPPDSGSESALPHNRREPASRVPVLDRWHLCGAEG